MTNLTLTTLGVLEFVVGDQPCTIHFRSAKTRALLTYLALETERPHPRRSLALLLWPDLSEEKGFRNLRKTLFYLREALDQADPGSSQRLLGSDRHTVQLYLNNLAIDVIQIKQLLENVAQHPHPQLHSCVECIARLVAVESKLQGELLAGFSLADATEFETWLQLKRDWIQQQSILILTHLATVFEQQDNFVQVEEYATRLLAIDPYNENGVRHLMRVMAQTDRRHAALQLYQRFTDLLRHDIDTLPQEQTRLLYQKIEANDSEKLPPEPTLEPTRLHHFPTQFSPFLGRTEQLTQITDLLSKSYCRLLTIIGEGGIGKTRLVSEFAKGLATNECFRDGIYFANLVPVNNGVELLGLLAITLSIIPKGDTPLLTQIVDFLKEKDCLLVLDNFEHLVGNEQMVSELLEGAPSLTILVTSRQPLYLRAEHQIRLGGLAFPKRPSHHRDPADLEQVSAYDAIRFFVQSAQRIQAEFSIDPDNMHAIMRISDLVQGSPLALEIAATWIRLMDVETVAKTIEQSQEFLVSPIQDLPDRHRSMGRVFDYSWDLLSPAERLTLGKASIFRETFQLATAVSVLDTSMGEIGALVDKSLLQRLPAGRYSMHELLRQYTLDKLRTLPNGHEAEMLIRQKHCHHYLTFLARIASDFDGSQPQLATTEVRKRWGDIVQSWSWIVEHLEGLPNQELLGASVDGLGSFCNFNGLFVDGARMVAEALTSVELLAQKEEKVKTVTQLLSHLLAWQAYFKNCYGETDQAIQIAQRSLDYGEPHLEAVSRAKSLLSELLPNVGQFDQAETYQQEAISYYSGVGNLSLQAKALGRLGVMRWRRGRHSEAIPVIEEALSLYQKAGNKGAMATLHGSIAGAFFEMGKIKLAQMHVEKARMIFTEIEKVTGVAQTDGYLSHIHKQLGQYQLALDHNQREIDIYRRLGDRPFLAQALGNKSWCLYDIGAFDEALISCQEAIRITEELGRVWHCANHGSLLAMIWHAKGDDEQAMILFEKSLPVLRRHGAQYYFVEPLLHQAALLLSNNRVIEAQTRLEEARQAAKGLKIESYIFEAGVLFAKLAFAQGNAEQAINDLLKLLSDSDERAKQAILNYELWRMGAGFEYGHIALKLYTKMFEQNRKYEFQKKITELQVGDLNSGVGRVFQDDGSTKLSLA